MLDVSSTSSLQSKYLCDSIIDHLWHPGGVSNWVDREFQGDWTVNRPSTSCSLHTTEFSSKGLGVSRRPSRIFRSNLCNVSCRVADSLVAHPPRGDPHHFVPCTCRLPSKQPRPGTLRGCRISSDGSMACRFNVGETIHVINIITWKKKQVPSPTGTNDIYYQQTCFT